MPYRRQKVFLSYAWADDQNFVRRLYADLVDFGWDPWMDIANMPSRGRALSREVMAAIDECDRVIAVIGPQSVDSEGCKAELEYAFDRGKIVNAVLRLGDYELVPPDIRRFFVVDFRESRPYGAAVEELKRVLAEPLVAAGPLFDVPAPPAHFQSRIHELRALRQRILDTELRPVAVTSVSRVGLHGMGGIGKSVMAAALARDYVVRRAFRDGILWLKVGPQPNLLSLLRQAGAALRADLADFTTVPAARMRLAEALSGKECLVVLDDVWNASHTEPFVRSLTPRCRLLITTRNLGVVETLDADVQRLDVLSDQESLELLARWANLSPAGLPEVAPEVMRECGNLPLALATIGALAGNDPGRWKNVLTRLRNADLDKLRNTFPDYPYPDLMRAIEVSVESLDPEARARYLDFAVFDEGVPVPEAVFHTFWKPLGYSEEDVQDRLDLFVQRSLATREPRSGLWLHALQHAYSRRHAEGGDIRRLHARLIDAYRERCADDWSAGPADGYFFQNLPRHLVHAGAMDELRRLFLDEAWLESKLRVRGSVEVIADFDLLPDDGDARLVQSSIRLSAQPLDRDPAQLRAQLHARLLSYESPPIAALRARISEAHPEPWLRLLTPTLTAPEGPLLWSLEGHTSNVRVVLATSDGRAISGSHDETLRIWDLTTGVETACLEEENGWVLAAALLPDDRGVVSGHFDGTIRLWDLDATPTSIVLGHHPGAVHAIAVIPGGAEVVSGSSDGSLILWNLDTRTAKRAFVAHTDWVRAIAIAADGKLIVSASDDATVRVWDHHTGQQRFILRGHQMEVITLTASPDGRHVVSGSNDRYVIVWDVVEGKEACRFEVGSPVLSLAITPDGKDLVTGLWDHTIRVWDLATGAKKLILHGHTSAVSAVATTGDGKILLSGSDDDTVRVWDVRRRVQMPTTKRPGSIHDLIVTPDGRHAVSTYTDQTLTVWDLNSGREERTLIGHDDDLIHVVATPDGTTAVSACDDDVVKVWDLNDGSDMYSVPLNIFGTPAGVLVTPDGRSGMVWGSQERMVTVLDLVHGVERFRLAAHDGDASATHASLVSNCALTPDGRRLVTAAMDGADHYLRVWSVEDGALLRTFKGTGTDVPAFALTPDGQRILLSSSEQSLALLDENAESGLPGESTGTYLEGVVVAPDGRLAASWHRRDTETVWVWDPAGDGARRPLAGHLGDIDGALFLPDAKHLLTWAADRTLRLWSAAAGNLIATLTCESRPWRVAIAPHGKTIVAGGDAGSIHFFHLENVDLGPLIVTAWRSAKDDRPAIGCPLCRRWMTIPGSAIGSPLACSGCAEALLVNAFVIESDWTPVAAAWQSRTAGSALTVPRPPIPPRRETTVLWAGGRLKEAVGHGTYDIAVPRHSVVLEGSENSGLASFAHPNADADRAARLNMEFITALQQWEKLPWWTRLRRKKPARPTGI